jgi:hypothetical protein
LYHWLHCQAHSVREGKPWLGLSNLHFVLCGFLWECLVLFWWMLVSKFDRKHLEGGLYSVLLPLLVHQHLNCHFLRFFWLWNLQNIFLDLWEITSILLILGLLLCSLFWYVLL